MSKPNKLERWKISPPAPLTEKSKLLADIKEVCQKNQWNIVHVWCGLEPTLHLIEAVMLEYTTDDQ